MQNCSKSFQPLFWRSSFMLRKWLISIASSRMFEARNKEFLKCFGVRLIFIPLSFCYATSSLRDASILWSISLLIPESICLVVRKFEWISSTTLKLGGCFWHCQDKWLDMRQSKKLWLYHCSWVSWQNALLWLNTLRLWTGGSWYSKNNGTCTFP